MAAPLAFRRPRTYTDRVRTWIEPLERRRLLSVTVENGIMIVRGTDLPEEVFVTMGSEPGRVDIEFGVHNIFGVYSMSNLRNITGVRIETGGGNDRVRVVPRGGHVLPMTVLGGAGNDTIIGSAADDSLDGQAGNDLIDGGGGNDTLPDAPYDASQRDPDGIYDRFDRVIATAKIVDGTLYVIGADGDQRIQVGDFDDDRPGAIRIMVDGESVSFDRDDIRAIHVDGGAGNDAIRLRSSGLPLKVPTTLSGGNGDDHLTGVWYKSGWPNDMEPFTHDELGPVTILGGDGSDTLYGSAGPTLLDGGPGIDQHELRGDDTTIVDPGEIPVVPPPAEGPAAPPVIVEHPVPSPAPEPTPTVPPSTNDPATVFSATPAAAPVKPLVAPAAPPPAIAVYHDVTTPWLGKAEDDILAN